MHRASWLVVASLLGCNTSAPAEPGGATVTGFVVYPGANTDGLDVTAIGPTSAGTKTSAGGAFTLRGLRDGSYLLHAEHPNAEPRDVSLDFELTNGVANKELRLTFTAPARQLSGRVEFSDGSDPTDVDVTLRGEGQALATRPGSDGRFRFEGVRSGVMELSARAANTAEAVRTLDVVTGEAALDVGVLRFTPVGVVQGAVVATNPWEASVTIAGTSLTATPLRDGGFVFPSVPVGAQTVVANARATFDTKDVAVRRGERTDVVLTPASMTAMGTGTVAGRVTIEGEGPLDHFTISVDGVPTLSTRTDSTGAFSLTLPLGRWTLLARGSPFPSQAIGAVDLQREGQRLTVPPATLSLFTTAGTIPETGMTFHARATCEHYSVLEFTRPNAARLVILDHQTGELSDHLPTPLLYFESMRAWCTPHDHLVLVGFGDRLFVHDRTKRRTVALTSSFGNAVGEVKFTTNPSVVFLVTGDGGVERHALDGTTSPAFAPRFAFAAHDRAYFKMGSTELPDLGQLGLQGPPSSQPILQRTRHVIGGDKIEANCDSIDGGCDLAYGGPTFRSFSTVRGIWNGDENLARTGTTRVFFPSGGAPTILGRAIIETRLSPNKQWLVADHQTEDGGYDVFAYGLGAPHRVHQSRGEHGEYAYGFIGRSRLVISGESATVIDFVDGGIRTSAFPNVTTWSDPFLLWEPDAGGTGLLLGEGTPQFLSGTGYEAPGAGSVSPFVSTVTVVRGGQAYGISSSGTPTAPVSLGRHFFYERRPVEGRLIMQTYDRTRIFDPGSGHLITVPDLEWLAADDPEKEFYQGMLSFDETAAGLRVKFAPLR